MTHEEAPTDQIELKILKILNVLQMNGRISNFKLVEGVAFSPTAVLPRVQRLTKKRIYIGLQSSPEPPQTWRRHDGVCRSVAGPHHAQCV